jgi:hypothetical protein
MPDDQTRVQTSAAGERPEFIGVLGDDEPIFRSRACKDGMIRIAQSAAIPRVDRVVHPVQIEMLNVGAMHSSVKILTLPMLGGAARARRPRWVCA